MNKMSSNSNDIISLPLSISAAERIFRCPGSAAVAALMPPLPAGKAALDGRESHSKIKLALESSKPTGDDVADGIATTTRELAMRLVGPGFDESVEEHVIIYDDQNRPVWHGYADYVASRDNVVLIVDWKTGWASDRTPAADRNLQLRLYAVGIAASLPENARIMAAIVTRSGDYTLAMYSGDGLKRARKEALRLIEKALDPDAKRVPGDKQCRYCPAAGTDACPESVKAVKALARMKADLMPALVLSRAYTRAREVKAVIEAIEARMHDLLERGEDVPGYELGPAKERVSVADPVKAAQIATEAGLTVEQFASAVTVSIPKLADALFRAKPGKYNKRQARAYVEEKLEQAEAIQRKTMRRAIVEKKQAAEG